MSLSRKTYRPLKEKVNITLDEKVADAIRRLSEQDQVNFSQYINRVLRQYIERRRKE